MRSRRNFIANTAKSSAMLAATPALGSLLAGSKHADAEPHFIVYVQIYGAWDVCLAFDPKDRESRLSTGDLAFDQPYAIDEVRTFGNVRLAPQGFALSPFANRIAVVNGIDMELDSGHTPLIVMTGDPQGAGGSKPSIQALVSDRHPHIRRCLMPHMYASYDGFFSGGALAGKTVTISKIDAHRVLFSPGGAGSLRSAEQSTRSASDAYDAVSRQKIGQYIRALSQAASLRETLNQNGGSVPAPGTAEQFGDFAAILFKMGLLGSLTWSLGEAYEFDTHSNHYSDHPLEAALKDIAAFSERLAALPFDDHSSVLDRTTIVIAGEFARTPRLNSSHGKDHNFRTNSMVFLGANVTSGVYGSSGERRIDGRIDAHAGLAVNLQTGLPDQSGEILKTRNVWAGAGSIFGVDLARDFGNSTRPVRFLGI